MQDHPIIRLGPDGFSWWTNFPPIPGHILEANGISCPVGQNFLEDCVPLGLANRFYSDTGYGEYTIMLYLVVRNLILPSIDRLF